MATTSTARRPLVGILLIVAGAAALLDLLFAYVAPGFLITVFGFIVDVALGLAFAFLAGSRGSTLLLRIAFVVAAVGWLVLALCTLVPGLAGLSVLGQILALVGSLAAGILVFVHSTFSRSTNLWFLIAMIVAAVFLLNTLTGFAVALSTLLVIVFGAALVVAGFFVLQRH